jgi:hypothetical protein
MADSRGVLRSNRRDLCDAVRIAIVKRQLMSLRSLSISRSKAITACEPVAQVVVEALDDEVGHDRTIAFVAAFSLTFG